MLLELLEAYLLHYGRKQARISPRMLKNYCLAVRDFLAWCWPPQAPAPREAILRSDRETLAQCVASLQTQGSHLEPGPSLSPGTIALRLAGVRQFYRALEWAGVLHAPDSPPVPGDSTPPEERRPALPLTWYRRLLEHLAQSDDPVSLRDRIAVRLAGECGLRLSELVGLRTGDLLLEERLLQVRGKGGKQRRVPLARSLVGELEAWLRLRQALGAGEARLLLRVHKNGRLGKGLLANGLWWCIRQHYRAIGLPGRCSGVHMLRHTAGTRFYRASRDLHATARLLGHASPTTSAIYAKMDLEGLFQVVDRLDEEAIQK